MPRKTPGARVAEAAATGDQRATLEAIRDQLAHQIDRAVPAATPALARQLRMTLRDLAELPAEHGKGSKTDEVKARRDARRARASRE